MIAIEVKDLVKNFGSAPVLDGISFTAKSGEVVALLGESGAGKSTLLRCLNLLAQPDSGQMKICGFSFDFSEKPISKKALIALRTHVGMVFQQYHLWPHKTILQNCIEAPIQVLKLPKVEAVDRARELLSEIGILEKTHDYPAALSGGQQQRVAIARALMMSPKVMLFDEPTSALDPQRVSGMIKMLGKLAEKGVTVVVATHEMKFAQELADQIIFLRNGKILPQRQSKKIVNFSEKASFEKSKVVGI